jgi:hypothetical protein
MNCPFQMNTGVYALGALTPHEHLQMRIHVKDCLSCQADIADFIAVLRLLRNTAVCFRPRSCRARFIDWLINN